MDSCKGMKKTTEFQLVPKSAMNWATTPVYTFMVHKGTTFFDLTNAIYYAVLGLPIGQLWAHRQEDPDIWDTLHCKSWMQIFRLFERDRKYSGIQYVTRLLPVTGN